MQIRAKRRKISILAFLVKNYLNFNQAVLFTIKDILMFVIHIALLQFLQPWGLIWVLALSALKVSISFLVSSSVQCCPFFYHSRYMEIFLKKWFPLLFSSILVHLCSFAQSTKLLRVSQHRICCDFILSYHAATRPDMIFNFQGFYNLPMHWNFSPDRNSLGLT